jgi:uncharacterized protein (DUF1697 family)
VALLRGINVGTAKAVAMDDLRACFEGLGYTNVSTVLRSGNVVFDATGAVGHAEIEKAILETTGVSSAVVVIEGSVFREIVAENPLASVSTDPSRALIQFLDAVPDDTGTGRPDDDALLPERLAFGPRAIYQWCPDGISKSKVPPKFFTGLGTAATGRNLRTAQKLVALLDLP